MKQRDPTMDMRDSGNCGTALEIKPDGRRIERAPLYYEEIPRDQKDFKRLNHDLRIWEKRNKRIWI